MAASSTLIIPGSSINNGTITNTGAFVVGYVSSPNSRGTFDILWSCFFTIFICTWTGVCLNVPHPKDTQKTILLRQAKWMFWAIVGPEVVLSVAIGQYASARRSIRRFHKLGCKEKWTLRHAFFADMGGILLRPENSKPFVVNARQVAYLVEHKYISCPEITAEDIWDKSKADTLTRVLALAQTSWFIIQLIGRAVEGIATTTLELSTAALVLCTLGTFICWFHKPRDVWRGVEIRTKATTAQILLEAGDAAAKPYRHTPLDFVAKESPTCSYDVMGLLNMRCDSLERPLRRFPDDRFPNISTFEKFALFCLTLAYASLHLVGWNFRFPSRTEALLWKISSLFISITTLMFWTLETIAARQRFGRWDKYLIWLHLKEPKKPDESNAEKHLDPDDAFEQEQKNSKPIPLWEVMLILPVILFYVAARGYMIVEVFLSLRKLPIGVYIAIDFAQCFPHW